MNRVCPVCDTSKRELLWSMEYKEPDGWPLQKRIDWYTCNKCGVLYGDGDFDQEMLNEYYLNYYGYGINSPENRERLQGVADDVMRKYPPSVRFVDFGGGGDDGRSIAVEYMQIQGYTNAINVNAGDTVPQCDVILASHVLEHVYDMNEVMEKITGALVNNGLLIVDGPNATGLVLNWGMPMLDFHTKHVNHFRMIDYLRLMERWGFELVDSESYVDVRSNQIADCLRLFFKRISTAKLSYQYVTNNMLRMLDKLKAITFPVNIWGLGDITRHLLTKADIKVLNYIDNDPSYRGATMDGKPVVELPDNDAPILVMVQGQRDKLMAHIKELGLNNEVINI